MLAYDSRMATTYRIGQLATAADVPTSTLRYYERVGILRPGNRSAGNYRLYDEGDLERVRFIRAAQATGFTLDDVKVLLELRVASGARCEDIQVLMEDRLSGVKNRMKDLRHVERVLKSFLTKCRESNRQGHCAVIDELNATSTVASRLIQRESEDEIARALRASNFPRRVGVDKTQLRTDVLRLVANGRPVSLRKVGQLADNLGMPVDSATSFISRVSERDEDGNIVGILGLSQRSHPHRFELKNRVLSTWCAWDALFLPALLGQSATVESSCPATKQRVRLRVTPTRVREISPSDCVVTIAVPAKSPEAVEEIWSTFCHFVFFFASAEAASRWISKRRHDLRIVSVAEAYNIGRRAFPASR